MIGVILWVVGFALECAADSLKYAFKQNPANKGRFVNVGERSCSPAGRFMHCCVIGSNRVVLLIDTMGSTGVNLHC